MSETTTSRLTPLVGWLILALAVATLFPLKLEHLTALFIATTILSLIWLPGRLRRSIPFLLIYVSVAFLALTIPIPLPSTWNPLATLLTILIIWSTVLILSLSVLMSYLLRTASPQHSHQHQRQRHQQP